MTRFLVDHPDDWIGIPETWPFGRWQTPLDWATEFVALARGDWGVPEPDAEARLRESIATVAASRDPDVADRIYFSAPGWAGPITLAAMVSLSVADAEGRTAEEIAGATDDSVAIPVTVTEFATDEGAYGVSCVRYVANPENGDIVARADFVVRLSDAFVDFFHESYDLVRFRQALPRLQALASSVTEAG